MEVDYPNYTLYIEAAVEDQQYFSEMSVTMDIIKPCHIVYHGLDKEVSVHLLHEHGHDPKLLPLGPAQGLKVQDFLF